ncbi:hypothetical protein AS594_35420 [Streptomyces agglomeratus]|uniref:Integrase catalytic domain-containing protein n=2 Tax=Streptomyces agglomeratus TaxID=285458 RepID=A0A1E5PHC2_9ACTN|nr:hypothetical protein AS594_35420 [Streptomyces agglomeratus]
MAPIELDIHRGINAMAEALNGSFKAELIEHQGPWRDADQVEHAVVQWVGWYNTERLHPALGYLPPEEFETHHYQLQATTNAAVNHTTRRYKTGNSSGPFPIRGSVKGTALAHIRW